MPLICIKKLHPEAHVPKTWSERAVGFDLHAICYSETGRPNNVAIPPFSVRNIPCGFAMECPRGLFAEVRSRSGLASRGIFVANAPGTIDPDYRGEIRVLLYNGSQRSFFVSNGDRIAQLVFAINVTEFFFNSIADHQALSGTIVFAEVDELSPTGRGEDGFGSTGGLNVGRI